MELGDSNIEPLQVNSGVSKCEGEAQIGNFIIFVGADGIATEPPETPFSAASTIKNPQIF